MARDILQLPNPEPGKEVMAPSWLLALIRGEEIASAEARTNPITGLPNRRGWEEEVFGRRNSRHPFTVLIIDLDGFKAINDTYGHAIGDEVIKDAATLITSSVRPDDFPANPGGDEFGVILDVSTGDPDKTVNAVIRRMKERFEKYNESHDIKLNFSVGSATSHYEEGQVHDVYKTLHDADMAMYKMKESAKSDH